MITSTELDKSPEISKIATGTNNACQNVINQQGNQHLNTKTTLSLNFLPLSFDSYHEK